MSATGLTGKIPAGGFDLTPGTLSAIQAGTLNFTIDQEPYLQGFLPALYLYLFNLTGGLVLPPDTDTGLTFVTKSNVGPYLNTKTSYEGSTGAAPTLVPRSGPIQNPPPPPAPDGCGDTRVLGRRAGGRILVMRSRPVRPSARPRSSDAAGARAHGGMRSR